MGRVWGADHDSRNENWVDRYRTEWPFHLLYTRGMCPRGLNLPLLHPSIKKKEGRICVEDLPSLKYNRTYHRIFSGENALVYLFLESWRAHKRNPSFENSKLRVFQPLRISLNFLEWTRVRKQVKYCRFKTKTKEYYQTCWLYSWVADFRAPFPSLG